ncbi:ribokinase [Labrys monachus]|uniref:Ribokinase n=1 Tax=Labrys monachus TaxID=217067 RepID=A0ABU0FKL3_9HYPH|nr:ribokinase [Labrys monachus]MDQ0394892.1 ribokinase [Labrys monachus]
MIVVFGSVAVDLVVNVPHIPRPGESLQAPCYTPVAGSKGGNQALAAARSGARVVHVASVGRDGYAEAATAALRAEGVDLSHIALSDKATGICLVAVAADGENTVIAAAGANLDTSVSQLEAVAFGSGDTLVLQMEVPLQDNVAAVRLAKARGARVILNVAPAGPVDGATLSALHFLIVNEHEAMVVAKALGLAATEPEEAARAIHDRCGCSTIVTLGPRGAVAYHRGSAVPVAAPEVAVLDTTGAGDSFTGAFAAALDAGEDLTTALRRAVAGGSLACTVHGAQTSIPRLDAILAAMRHPDQPAIDDVGSTIGATTSSRGD